MSVRLLTNIQSFGPEIVSPPLTLFESFLLEQLPMYYSDSILTFILATIASRHDPPPLANFPDHVAQIFGVPQASGFDSEGLHLFSFFSTLSRYKDMLAGLHKKSADILGCRVNIILYRGNTLSVPNRLYMLPIHLIERANISSPSENFFMLPRKHLC